MWDFACPDWEARLAAGRSLIPDLPLDPEQADRAVGIFDNLRLPDVEGRPFMIDAAGDWQRDIVRAVFGSLDNGVRRVAEVFNMVPKKSSKTTGAAAIAIVFMIMNRRPRAEAIYVAPTQEIADTAFQQTVGMIEADEYLVKRFQIQHHTKTITDRRNKARLKVKTFDMKVVTGSKPAFVLIDELHILSSIAGADRVIGQIRGGILPNPEAVLIMITTQSDTPPAGVFKAELQYARAVRDGKVKNSRLLPLIYEFAEEFQRDEDKPWRDARYWPMVMPNLGRSVTLDRLIQDYEAARAKGDAEERRWASQHLNIEIGMALHSNRWIGVDYWPRQANPSLTLDEIIERSEVIVVGVDGGGLDDLLGASFLGRDKETREWLHRGRAWAHKEVLERRKSEAQRLRDFEADGDLVIVDRIGEDIDELAEMVARIDKAGLLAQVGLDPVGVGAIVDALAKKGIGGERDKTGKNRVVGVSQGYRLTGAIKTAERKLADSSLMHAGQPLMAWAVSNAKRELKGNAVIITKEASGTGKIDPLMALFDSVALMSNNPEPPKGGPVTISADYRIA